MSTPMERALRATMEQVYMPLIYGGRMESENVYMTISKKSEASPQRGRFALFYGLDEVHVDCNLGQKIGRAVLVFELNENEHIVCIAEKFKEFHEAVGLEKSSVSLRLSDVLKIHPLYYTLYKLYVSPGGIFAMGGHQFVAPNDFQIDSVSLFYGTHEKLDPTSIDDKITTDFLNQIEFLKKAKVRAKNLRPFSMTRTMLFDKLGVRMHIHRIILDSQNKGFLVLREKRYSDYIKATEISAYTIIVRCNDQNSATMFFVKTYDLFRVIKEQKMWYKVMVDKFFCEYAMFKMESPEEVGITNFIEAKASIMRDQTTGTWITSVSEIVNHGLEEYSFHSGLEQHSKSFDIINEAVSNSVVLARLNTV